jgi:hypothetical protein
MPEKPSKLLPALYGGVVMAAISAMPFVSIINCFCCAGVLLGGFLAVFFYQKDLTAQTPLTNSDALQLGALAGVFGAIIGTVLSAMVMALFGNVTSQIVLDIIRGFEDKMPPGTMEQIEQSMSQSSELGIMGIMMAFFTSIIVDPLFGLLGGLIGYSVYKPKPGVFPPMMPPTPPASPAAPGM